MIRNFFLSLLLCVLSAGSAFSASNTTVVNGRVIDKNSGNPLSYATVAIRNDEDVVVAGATSAEDGTFEMANVPYGSYRMITSFMGYKNLEIDVTLGASKLDVGTIELEEDAQTLATAVITAKVPVIEHKLDKIVMNVSEAVSTQGSNALEVLRKAPGVTIDMDGNVKLNGQAVSVWIDGRPSYLSGLELEALLRSTDGTTIDKIELMAHPSAKYDAEGSGGIINIRMKKNVLKGFNGSVNGFYGGMKHERYEQEGGGGLTLNYRSAKTNTMVNYNGRYEEMGAVLDSRMGSAGEGGLEQIAHADFLIGSENHNLKLANDYFLNKKNTVGFILTSMLSGNSQDNFGDQNYTNTYYDNQLISSRRSKIQTDNDHNNIRGNLNYTGLFNENKGQEVTFNADYAYFDILSMNNQNNELVSGIGFNEIFRQQGQQYINMFSGKADYQQTFWKTGMLEAGVKWAMTETNNNLFREDYSDGSWNPNPGMSNVFNYTEQISAAYISLGRMLGSKWMFKLGLRGEYTYALGNWVSAAEKTEKNYFNLFPTVFAGFNPSANWNLTLSYTSRISRPSFSQLNPFTSYIDANTYVQGNPYLDPQRADQVMLGAGFKSHYNLTLIYAHTKNLIMQSPLYNEETGMKVFMYDNFGTQTMAGASLSVSELPIVKWLTFTFSGTCLYMGNTATPASSGTPAGTANYVNDGLLTNAYGQFTFLLPKDWKIELMGMFQGPIPYGYFKIDPIFISTAGIKKTFMDNKATLSLNINDIFNSFANNLSYSLGEGMDTTMDQKINLQKIQLSFNFRFGQSKATRTRKVGDFDEASRVGTTGGISTGTSGGLK